MAPSDPILKLVKRRPRWRKWLRRAAVALLALLVLSAVGYGVLSWRLRVRVRGAVEALDQNEAGWKIEDLEAGRAAVPEEENGARVVTASYALLRPDWRERNGDFLDRVYQSNLNARLSERLFADLDEDFDNVRPALVEAEKLVDRPRGRHHIAYARNVLDTLLNDQEQTRVVTRLLVHEAVRRGQLGEMKGVLRACRAAVNAARSLGDEPLYLSQLLRVACVAIAADGIEHTLAQGEPPGDELERLQRLLEDEDRHPGLLVLMRGERATRHAMFEVVEKGEARLSETLGKSSSISLPESAPEFLLRDLVRAEHPQMLKVLTGYVEAARLPPHEQARRERALDTEISALSDPALLTRWSLTPTQRMGPSFRRIQAQVRCLIAALAIERYRQRHQSWPKGLTDLAPFVDGRILVGPFDGKPLRYRRLPDGVLVYSIGPDETDNGGVMNRKKRMEPGTDVGCRLWDVERRGAPPRPVEGR
jgi:hypothetical protein